MWFCAAATSFMKNSFSILIVYGDKVNNNSIIQFITRVNMIKLHKILRQLYELLVHVLLKI